jgi:hypothetical protein
LASIPDGTSMKPSISLSEVTPCRVCPS